ncbi:MAG: hypothetical protein A2075_12120 [Geobacteraceae bacterium GWC2_58_44]|nr:MAG: hypothetical protein A2075_12120 [Geobacteraceae bacterium GWC2_58_44]HBG06308.1 hypothetical protein [Geobacter sp.]
MSNDLMSLRRRELLRVLPFLALFGLTLFFYKGDYEQFVGAVNILSIVSLVALFGHYVRKTLFPYANLQVAWTQAVMNQNMPAAVVYVAKIAFLFGLIWLAASFITPRAANAASEPSAKAKRYLPVLKTAIDKHWPAAPMRHYIAGQIEQESAGWQERAEMKGKENGKLREYGFGLGQITIAYNKDGSERFNNFVAAQRLFRDWKWEDRFNVKYQLGYAVVTNRGNFRQVSRLMRDDDSRWRASLVAYNAGYGTVLQRRALAIRSGVPADRWVGGLDQVAMGYEQKLLYGRPLVKMRNEYPRIICDVRAPKYRRWV